MRDDGTGRRGAWRRWLIALGLATCAGIAVGVLSVMALVEESPTWWRSPTPTDPVTIESARRLENGVVTELHYARPAGPEASEEIWSSDAWTVALGAPDANAWLTARLPRWLASSDDSVVWPEELSKLQVEFDEGRIHIGIEVGIDGMPRVLSATLRPSIDEDGRVWMRARTVRVGRLGLPAGWVLRDSDRIMTSYMPEELHGLPEARDMFSAFRGELPLVNEPVLTLEDGRRVRLLSLASRDGYLEITCRTEREGLAAP